MIENKILYYLKRHCTGIQNAISKDALARLFSITSRELRQEKRNIVLNIDARVGSTSSGYFYAENDNQIAIFRAEYMSRVRELLIMVKAYENEIAKRDQLTII